MDVDAAPGDIIAVDDALGYPIVTDALAADSADATDIETQVESNVEVEMDNALGYPIVVDDALGYPIISDDSSPAASAGDKGGKKKIKKKKTKIKDFSIFKE